MDGPPLEVMVWGSMACFTRPEFKVERVSYPAPTPSAARGILEAIFWKPEFSWRVREIHVLRPIRYFSLVRNEVQRKAASYTPLLIEDERTQRHSLALRDVAYLLRADVELKPGVEHDPAKYRDQFRRRVERGQCFHRPALGCREFAAEFGPAEPDARPIHDPERLEIGPMLFDLRYRGPRGPHEPLFFNAALERGVLYVPPSLYTRLEGAAA